MSRNPENSAPPHLLVVRFSAFGNVVMIKPVLEYFCNNYPEVKITFLSRNIYRSVFSDINGLDFIGINTSDYPGLAGIRRLVRELKEKKFTHYLDLHSVFRTFLMGLFIGLPVYRIRKDRWQKFRMTRRWFKNKTPITHTSQVYADVFRQTGIFKNDSFDITNPKSPKIKPGQLNIGIAPMSKNRQKEWPLPRMNELAEILKNKLDARIYIFGAKEERPVIEENFSNKNDIVAGSMSMEEEIDLIKSLSFMISMDSGNMHLASVFGVPVVSIWGPTHPDAAFGPRGSLSLVIQDESLECRPCSIYGQIPCYRKDHACMNNLSVENVFKEIKSFIEKYQK